MTWLISSMGYTPSVLTEALWYLEEKLNLPVDGLTCVGTRASLETSRDALFKEGGALDRLRTVVEKRTGRKDWMVEGESVLWEIGAQDSRSLEDAIALDQAFYKAILDAQTAEGHDGPVIACISGGRKNMSSSLQQAMSLLATGEDWAFHVLLDLPEGMEEKDIPRDFGFPGDPNHPDLAKVGVVAFEVPLVRLREFASARKIDLADPDLVKRLQKAVQDSSKRPGLVLKLKTLTLEDPTGTSAPLGLSPQLAMLLAAYIAVPKPQRIQDVQGEMLEVVDCWERLKMEENSEGFPTSFRELKRTISYWVNAGEVDPPQKCRLNTELIQHDPAWHLFRIRSRKSLQGEKIKGLQGFSDEAYLAREPMITLQT